MKKIIALLLVMCCVLTLAACDGNDDNPDNGGVDNSQAISDMQSALDASAPDVADITVVLKSSLGDLNGSYNIVYNQDGTALLHIHTRSSTPSMLTRPSSRVPTPAQQRLLRTVLLPILSAAQPLLRLSPLIFSSTSPSSALL